MKQNNCLEIYTDYFSYEDGRTGGEEPGLSSVSECRDPVTVTQHQHRPVRPAGHRFGVRI